MKQFYRFRNGLISSPLSFSLVTLLVVVLQVVISLQLSAQASNDPAQKKMGELARSYYQSKIAGSKPGGLEKITAVDEHFLTGATASDHFGYSVASAGDVNGDGYADIIVGAYSNDAGGTDAGRAYIYFGGASMHTTPDVILTGAAAGDQFGISVSSAGDVNGDGYADVIVGAYLNDAGGTNAGRAYIYFGGVSMNTTPDVTLTGAAASDWFGYSVSSAGDVNGDGYADVIVGAFYNAAGGIDAGRAYIFFGGASMNNTPDVILTGATAGDWFGYSVSSAGDVNGDGYGDVIVGAKNNNAGGTKAGRAYIYFGGVSMNNTPDVTLTGAAANDYFGYSVSCAGDVNGDGYADIIVGALDNDAGGINAGRAYIYFGGASMDNTPDVTLTGAAAGDLFGISVSSAGDVNGDGYGDVIVGAAYNNAGGTDAGRAYIFFGGASMDNVPDKTLTGAAANDEFGLAVSNAGDVNGDGYSDIIVGAPYNSAGGTYAGRAYVYCNSLTGTDIPDEHFTGAAAGDIFSCSVSNAGDVNGDGYDDVIVGARGNSAGGAGAGRAYIYFGGSNMHTSPDVTLTGDVAFGQFGISVSSAGDVNGDGYDDVIIGAFIDGAYGSSAGRAYIYFGGVSMDNTPDVILTGAAVGDEFGISVASAGDVNGDGYSDVIVGAESNDAGGTDAGRAYIYFGGASMDSTADVILTGAAAGDFFGVSVSSAGDCNGDGYSDIIVGAFANDAGGTNAGSAYIYFGGVSMDNTPDVTLTGAAASDYFGYSVASAGDVNGDGYSDVIVGADYNDAGGTDAGRAYIYFGGVSMNNTADVILTGAAAGDNFGCSVSGMGDVNGDGYDDVIVGARGNSAGGAGAGRAYIYFGGVSMNNTADVIFTGAAGDLFSFSVSNAGDVNGDGYADVIVGAPYNSAGGNSAGRAYLYKSSSPPIVPRIAQVSDVPFDQGGSVNIRWIRSGYDAKSINRVTQYLLQRSNPPGIGGYAWQTVATISATHEPQYSYIAETPNDSMTNNSGTYFFRVTARTSNLDEYWHSNIISGHSVDNISPSAPGMLKLALLTKGPIELSWSLNETDPDVWGYKVYRSTSSGFTVGPATYVLSTTDTLAVDSTVAHGSTYFYRVTAVDIHGNESIPSEEKSQGTTGVDNRNEEAVPRVFSLLQNYPNPFNPTTTISFTLAEDTRTTLKIYDILGREVSTLINEELHAGVFHKTNFDASKLSSGMYIYRLQAGNNVQVKKLLLLK